MNISDVTDAQVIYCMMAHGGSFVRALANAAARADADNLRIIKTAFKTYWRGYAELVVEQVNREVPQ